MKETKMRFNKQRCIEDLCKDSDDDLIEVWYNSLNYRTSWINELDNKVITFKKDSDEGVYTIGDREYLVHKDWCVTI